MLRLTLIYLLFCSALLEFDGNPLPLRLNFCAMIGASRLARCWCPNCDRHSPCPMHHRRLPT